MSTSTLICRFNKVRRNSFYFWRIFKGEQKRFHQNGVISIKRLYIWVKPSIMTYSQQCIHHFITEGTHLLRLAISRNLKIPSEHPSTSAIIRAIKFDDDIAPQKKIRIKSYLYDSITKCYAAPITLVCIQYSFFKRNSNTFKIVLLN